MIEQAKEQLRSSRHKFHEDIEVGGMIEIPAAALALGPFLSQLDFISIGTNDLIQYTLAIDRADGAVAHLYDPLHPAVLRLVSHTIQTSTKAEIPVTVCVDRVAVRHGAAAVFDAPRKVARSQATGREGRQRSVDRARSACAQERRSRAH